MTALPVVRLRDFTDGSEAVRRGAVRTLGGSLEELGFVTLDGHGIEQGVLDAAFDCTARLFALPLDVKQRGFVAESGGNRGYVAYGRERALGATVADLKEFWHVGQEDVLQEHRRSLLPNVWLDDPTIADFRACMTGLYRRFESVAKIALHALAEHLELPADYFASMVDHGDSILRLIHYPAVPDDAPRGALRAAAHEDINLVTLLVEGTTGGLELLRRDGSWMPVSSLGGQIILDAGDMLARCTNRRIPSTTHRVVNPVSAKEPRYSIPFFVHPRPDVLLEPAPGTVTTERPATHPAITARAFLDERLRSITL